MKKNLFLICAILFTLNLTAAAQVVVPVNGGTPTLNPVTINNGAGDQYDPHVSGDCTAYTSDSGIRYYCFDTGIDTAIPMGASVRDLLSDISGSKIVFSRVIQAVKTTVMVFDVNNPTAAPIELNAAPGSNRIGSAIGGNTVAYIDFGLHPNGEVVIHDLATSTSARATNDSSFDQNPAVSPDGAVVTWEHCATSSTNCDIWQAVKGTAGWTVGVAMGSLNPEANPDTNGTLVVYDSIRGLDRGEIFWRPVGGGSEVQLQIPGVETNPSIAGHFIAFESRPTLFATSDIFVYDLVTNRLYQITNTPLLTEQLNDITVLDDGSLRVVWGSDEDGYDQRNVHAATFLLPGLTVFRDRSTFLDAAGSVTAVNFDQDPCGRAITVPLGYGGLLAGPRYSSVGVTFAAGVIFPGGQFATSSPNLISNAQINTPTPALVDGTFASPVHAVGIHNVGAEAVLRIFDAQGNLIEAVKTDADTLTFDFLGIVSTKPIHRFQFDFVSGLGFGGDDLVFTWIQTPDCTPPMTTATVSPTPNANGWNRTAVTVTLLATDNAGGSGVKEIRFSLTGAQAGAGIVAGSTASVPISAEGITTLSYFAVDNAENQEEPRTLTVQIDTTAPVLTVPGTITTNATSPAGATVSYSVLASDNLDPNPTVSCTPGSGSTFTIGSTTVTCAAADMAGNGASGTFQVIVRAAADQISNLIGLVQSFNLQPPGIANSLISKLQNALTSVNAGNITDACNQLGAFINEVRAQSGKALTVAQANQLIAAANQIKAVLGCP